MWVPDQNVFDGIRVENHHSEEELCRTLLALGQDATSSDPVWVFRGQERRQPIRKWPPIDEPAVKKHALEMEHLLPSDYREFEKRLEAGESKAGLQPLYGNRVAHIRSGLTTFLMQCHSAWHDHSVQAWHTNLAAGSRADKMLSIGQHYGLKTHLMDWTADWQTAVWFATHRWRDGSYVQGGDGVVYQLTVAGLLDAERTANTALGLMNPNEMCRHVDIRDTPGILAPRASCQRGFSIANIESPCFLQELIRANALIVHTFPRGVRSSAANTLTKPQLVPPSDEMGALFEEAQTGGALLNDVLVWIGKTYPALNASTADRPLIFA